MKYTFLKLCFAGLLIFSLPALAADEGAAKAEPPAAAAEKKVKADANPYRAEIGQLTRELSKVYSKDQAMALAHIRNGFGMTQAVRLVSQDVANAVTACGKDNPDMQGDMTGRFEKWNGSVEPLLKKSQADMEAAIHAGGFPDESKVKAYLDLIDKAAEYADSKIEKSVVTSPEACTGLLKSMDDTEPTMISLLQSIVWTPVVPSGEDGGGKE